MTKYHDADFGIAIDNRGAIAALELAAIRGDFDGYKEAMPLAFGHLAQKKHDKAVDNLYERALKECERLMDLNTPKTNAQLNAWSEIVGSYEDRKYPELERANKGVLDIDGSK